MVNIIAEGIRAIEKVLGREPVTDAKDDQRKLHAQAVQDAVVADVKPKLKEEERASAIVGSLVGQISQNSDLGMQALGNLDPEKISRLLDD